jgi:hypothetical protein
VAIPRRLSPPTEKQITAVSRATTPDRWIAAESPAEAGEKQLPQHHGRKDKGEHGLQTRDPGHGQQQQAEKADQHQLHAAAGSGRGPRRGRFAVGRIVFHQYDLPVS